MWDEGDTNELGLDLVDGRRLGLKVHDEDAAGGMDQRGRTTGRGEEAHKAGDMVQRVGRARERRH